MEAGSAPTCPKHTAAVAAPPALLCCSPAPSTRHHCQPPPALGATPDLQKLVLPQDAAGGGAQLAEPGTHIANGLDGGRPSGGGSSKHVGTKWIGSCRCRCGGCSSRRDRWRRSRRHDGSRSWDRRRCSRCGRRCSCLWRAEWVGCCRSRRGYCLGRVAQGVQQIHHIGWCSCCCHPGCCTRCRRASRSRTRRHGGGGSARRFGGGVAQVCGWHIESSAGIELGKPGANSSVVQFRSHISMKARLACRSLLKCMPSSTATHPTGPAGLPPLRWPPLPAQWLCPAPTLPQMAGQLRVHQRQQERLPLPLCSPCQPARRAAPLLHRHPRPASW